MESRGRLGQYARIVPKVVGVLVVAMLPLLPNAFYWAGDNSDIRYSFSRLFIPALLLSFWLLSRKRCRERLGRWERYLALPFLAALLVLIANGPVLLINALLPPQIPTTLEGTVAEKVSASAKSNARIVFVDPHGARHRWPVPGSVHQSAGVGDAFRVHAVRGGLGIPYVPSGAVFWELRPAGEVK